MKRYYLLFLFIITFFCLSCQNSSVSQMTLPTEYEYILADYEALIDFRLSKDFDSLYNAGADPQISKELSNQIQRDFSYKWNCMLIDMLDNLESPQKSSFGYFLYDTNHDGAPELFWVREDQTILAVFSICKQEVRLLDAFWSRYSCVLTHDGYLFTRSSDGWDYSKFRLLLFDTANLTPRVIAEFGIEASVYYEVQNGRKNVITKSRLDELISIYPMRHTIDWSGCQIVYPFHAE